MKIRFEKKKRIKKTDLGWFTPGFICHVKVCLFMLTTYQHCKSRSSIIKKNTMYEDNWKVTEMPIGRGIEEQKIST